ncbi:methyl jasmonate esterase 1 [Ricinus communis]|uniref:(S)-hydroxynitrile lyase n=1 Tax=Ricinus communis TaxID=3988 RepID=B9S8N3_RICCO|nr:methyl jasmonate esterase 1 [Ricinus communis]EEF40036.1 Polyneuridine-aldehyde esterase precursor, putative [Ricinus communis]|eukprot:XP_002522352.1 methylesterase 3 [Ricinus communis]
MEERQRHFVLIHGACHGAWCWYKVATLLKCAGHKVTALELAASGVHPKQVNDLYSFSDYYEPLMEFMMSLPPEERVILVGHSLGGLSLSVAMERFPEKVSAGVFATAFMPGPELSYFTLKEEFDRQFNSYMDMQYMFDNGPDNPPTSVLFGPNVLADKLYQLSPTEDLTLATLLIRHLPLYDTAAVQDAITVTEEKYGSVPRIYIVCDQDLIIKEDMQRWMVKNNPTDEVKIIAGSDHMAMFSKPQELCACLEEIAKKYL